MNNFRVIGSRIFFRKLQTDQNVKKTTILLSYRLSLLPDEDGGLGLPGHGPDVRRRVAPRELGLEVPEPLFQLGLVRVGVRLGEVEVRPPVGRFEAPVARAVLRVGVRVADELLWGE